MSAYWKTRRKKLGAVPRGVDALEWTRAAIESKQQEAA